jgi:hypothetical protein
MIFFLGRAALFLVFKGKSGSRSVADEFLDALRMPYILLRCAYRIWTQNIMEEVLKNWDLVQWHNVGACRLYPDRVVVSHWSARQMTLKRSDWELWIRKLTKDGTLGS